MNDVVPSVLVAVSLGMPLVVAARRVSARQAPLLLGAIALHIAAALAMVFIVRDYYGYGDMMGYWRGGMRLAAYIDADVVGNLPDVVMLLLQQKNPLQVTGNGWSTGSMHALSGLLCFAFGDSLFAICIFIALVGCGARFFLFSSVRQLLPSTSERAAAVVCLYIPSVVFWTSGLLKEGFATPALAIATGAAMRWFAGVSSPLRMAPLMAPSVVLIGLTKPYVLFPLTAALVIGFIWRRSLVSSGTVRIAERPLLLVGGVVAILVGIVVLGVLFPRYSIANFADASEDLRSVGASHAGGSTIAVSAGGGGLGLVLFAPVALATALFRPLIVEVRNPLMLVSAIEMSVFIGLTVRLFWLRPRSAFGVALRGSWLFAAAVVFVVIFGFAVGASTVNLGTLTRYRVPMLPFYGLAFVVLEAVRARLARGAARGVGP